MQRAFTSRFGSRLARMLGTGSVAVVATLMAGNASAALMPQMARCAPYFADILGDSGPQGKNLKNAQNGAGMYNTAPIGVIAGTRVLHATSPGRRDRGIPMPRRQSTEPLALRPASWTASGRCRARAGTAIRASSCSTRPSASRLLARLAGPDTRSQRCSIPVPAECRCGAVRQHQRPGRHRLGPRNGARWARRRGASRHRARRQWTRNTGGDVAELVVTWISNAVLPPSPRARRALPGRRGDMPHARSRVGARCRLGASFVREG